MSESHESLRIDRTLNLYYSNDVIRTPKVQVIELVQITIQKYIESQG